MTATGVTGPTLGTWEWCVPTARTFGLVRVPVPGGGAMWVDLFRTSRVAAVRASSPAALGGLTAVLGDDWRRGLLAALGPGGASQDEALAPGPLVPEWQRVALVYGVRQWLRAPVDEGVLDADEALAWAGAGVEAWASAVAASASYRVTRLVSALHAGRLPHTVHDDVERVAEMTVRSLADDDPDLATLLDLEESMERVTAIGDTELEELLAEELAVRGAAGGLATAGAVTLGGGEESRQGPEILVDPSTVDPRVIALDVLDRPSVTVQHAGDGVEVRVRLGAGYDSDTAEARDLLVFLADADSGEVRASAPVRPDGRRYVVAALAVDDPGAVRLVGVCARDALARVRTDPLGRSDATAEQCLLAAWGAGRIAAARSGPGTARLADTSLRTAEQAVFDADHRSRYGHALAGVTALVGGEGGTGPASPLLVERLFGLDLDDEGADDDDE